MPIKFEIYRQGERVTSFEPIAAAAIGSAWWARPRHANRGAALALAPAAVPLTAIAFAGTRTRRHPLIALAAAPFIVAGVVCSRHPADRK